MYHDSKNNYHLLMGSLKHAPSGDDRAEQLQALKQSAEQELKDTRHQLQKQLADAQADNSEVKLLAIQQARAANDALEEREDRMQTLEESLCLLECRLQKLQAANAEADVLSNQTQGLLDSKEKNLNYFENALDAYDLEHFAKYKLLNETYASKLNELKAMFSSNKNENERAYLVKIDKLQARCAEVDAMLMEEVKALILSTSRIRMMSIKRLRATARRTLSTSTHWRARRGRSVPRSTTRNSRTSRISSSKPRRWSKPSQSCSASRPSCRRSTRVPRARRTSCVRGWTSWPASWSCQRAIALTARSRRTRCSIARALLPSTIWARCTSLARGAGGAQGQGHGAAGGQGQVRSRPVRAQQESEVL